VLPIGTSRQCPTDTGDSRMGFSRRLQVTDNTSPAHIVPAKSWRKDTTDGLHTAHHHISHTTEQFSDITEFLALISMSIPTPSSIPSCCTDTFHYPALKRRKIKRRISTS